MGNDIIDQMGYLALGSRLKRLAERLQADAGRAHEELGFPMQPGHFPLLAALDVHGALTVSEAVEILGVSQPAVTRTLRSLESLGLATARHSKNDQRSKQIMLTAAGTAMISEAKTRLWPSIRRAATELSAGPDGDLLALLKRVETAIGERSLLDRIRDPQLPAQDAAPDAATQVVEYHDGLQPVFAAITRQWVEEMFTLEATDQAIIDNPRRTILDPGGCILFADLPGVGLVGTCALLPAGPATFELTKMGVLPSARGAGVGRFLIDQILVRAYAQQAQTLFLLTNHRCEAAIHLYKKAGFVHDSAILERYRSRYQRCDVAMSYNMRTRAPQPARDQVHAGDQSA